TGRLRKAGSCWRRASRRSSRADASCSTRRSSTTTTPGHPRWRRSAWSCSSRPKGSSTPAASSRSCSRALASRTCGSRRPARLTGGEICEALELERRPVEALLAAVASLGLVDVADGRYGLTALSEDYLLESSPTYMGFIFGLAEAGDWSLSMLDGAVSSDAQQ